MYYTMIPIAASTASFPLQLRRFSRQKERDFRKPLVIDSTAIDVKYLLDRIALVQVYVFITGPSHKLETNLNYMEFLKPEGNSLAADS